MIYLDYAATCPLDKDAAEAYIQASTKYYANSNSLHDMGYQAKLLIENCRSELGKLLGVDADGIYFTSGGTESNFLTLQALVSAKENKGNHIIAVQSEHSSIKNTLGMLEENGFEVTYLPLSKDGLIIVDQLIQSIKPSTFLITIQHVNSEIGCIQPLKQIGELCRQNRIFFHSDMVQSFGKLDVSPLTNYVDALSISSHKFYGPNGIGVAYVRPTVAWKTYFPNSTHEKGFRPGTINTASIVGMTVAAQKIYHSIAEDHLHYQQLREVFIKKLASNNMVSIINSKEQLPSIIGCRVSGIEGQWLMLECNRRGYAISTGSACQVGQQAPSPTLKAMGFSDGEAKEFIRISLGKETTVEDIEGFTDVLMEIMEIGGVKSR